jgi:hypothetical protein
MGGKVKGLLFLVYGLLLSALESLSAVVASHTSGPGLLLSFFKLQRPKSWIMRFMFETTINYKPQTIN